MAAVPIASDAHRYLVDADLTAPARRVVDLQRGRLTMNGFFTCTRRAA
jgi:hypothetical protein